MVLVKKNQMVNQMVLVLKNFFLLLLVLKKLLLQVFHLVLTFL